MFNFLSTRNSNLLLFLSIILISLFTTKSIQLLKKPKYEVVAVVEIFRHGARTPLLSGGSSDMYYGTKNSQLTINGFRQHILLGRWFKVRYIDGKITKLIKSDLNKVKLKEIEIITAGKQRSIFSVSAHVLGIFKNAIIKLNLEGHSEIKNNDTPPIKGYESDARDGREVQINVKNSIKDTMFSARECRYKNSKESLIKLARRKSQDIIILSQKEIKYAVDDIFHHYGKIIKQKVIRKGKGVYSLKNFKKLVSFIRPLKYHLDQKLKVKKRTLLSVKKFVINKMYNYRLKETKEKKIFVSRIFDKIRSLFEKKSQGKTTKKLLLLSGFDNTIVDVILNLFKVEYIRKLISQSLEDKEVYSFLTPPLASNFIFELIKKKNHYFVRFIYNGEVLRGHLHKNIKIPYNGLIKLHDFLVLIKSRIDYDYKKLECGPLKVLKK